MDGFDIMNKNENMRIQQNRPYVMNRYKNNTDLKKKPLLSALNYLVDYD
jgi:hypothetical protein